jgi:hypothetical protein
LREHDVSVPIGAELAHSAVLGQPFREQRGIGSLEPQVPVLVEIAQHDGSRRLRETIEEVIGVRGDHDGIALRVESRLLFVISSRRHAESLPSTATVDACKPGHARLQASHAPGAARTR